MKTVFQAIGFFAILAVLLLLPAFIYSLSGWAGWVFAIFGGLIWYEIVNQIYKSSGRKKE
jgi:hypothetical protein